MTKIKSGENFALNSKEKEKMIKVAEKQFEKFLDSLNFDWRNDPNMNDTPHRVSKMYVNEIISGCYSDPPVITAFDNVNKYDGIVFSGHITVNSICSHHWVPFTGKCFVSYIPSVNGKVIGLSKLNRIVDYYCRRPQIQENLTMQIWEHLDKVLGTNLGIAVLIEADHLCVAMRGAKQNSTMITSKLSGSFLDSEGAARKEFYDSITYVKNSQK